MLAPPGVCRHSQGMRLLPFLLKYLLFCLAVMAGIVGAALLLVSCTVVKDPDTGVAVLTTPADSQYQRLTTARVSYESWDQKHSPVIRATGNSIGNMVSGIITAWRAPQLLKAF